MRRKHRRWRTGTARCQGWGYAHKDIATLVARGSRAFAEYAPIRPPEIRQPPRIHRRIAYGPLLDVFVLDMRSFRGPNIDAQSKTLTVELVDLNGESQFRKTLAVEEI